ncbi:hypothetical protein ACWFNS_00825 [Oerskovia enterophila]
MSATDHGPSNHDDELSRALRDLVDDASLSGLDAHLDVVRGRTRRRRAAKKVALGATTLCVAGALGVAAITLPQDVRPEPIAPAESPSPSATPTETPVPAPTFPTGIDAAALACQQPAPTPTGDELPAHLSIRVPDLTVQTAGSVTAPVLLRFDGDARLRYADSATGAYVVSQDGVIVSSSLPSVETTGEATPAPGSSVTWEVAVATSASCGTADAQSSLPVGDYEVFALHRFPLTGLSDLQPDGTWGEETTGALFDGWLVADPVRLTIAPKPEPVEVRDVISADTSAIFESLRRAATSGAPAALDLFDYYSEEYSDEDWMVHLPDGSRVLTVPMLEEIGSRSRTASDDGWSMTLYGGAAFTDSQPEAYTFKRYMGLYDVTLDESGPKPTFTLQIVAGGTPQEAPPTRDELVCRSLWPKTAEQQSINDALEADLDYLMENHVAAVDSPRYNEVRARWIDSPRNWWWMLSHVWTTTVHNAGGDAVIGACPPPYS